MARAGDRNGTAAPDGQLTILRYSGELSTKARPTRYQFTQRLLHNLRNAVESHGAEADISVSHDRIFARVPEGPAEAALTRVFGIQTISRAEKRSACDLEAIVRHGEELFRDAVRGKRFAVRARRVGNRRPGDIRTADVMRELGSALLPYAAGVDLRRPEAEVHLEISGGEVYFFRERTKAQGGLPLGVGGRAVALVSGGFDSAVAAWHLLRRGVSLDYVFCNLGGTTHQLGTLRVTKVLADRWSYGERPRFHTVEFGPIVEELKTRTRTRYWQILLKRLMLRSAERIARDARAIALVTGESVGQVSSQTLQNLAVISQATSAPILRPLVGFNKEEIIDTSRRIGTYELSKVVGEYCDMVPSKPATSAALDAILAEEAKLDLGFLDRCTDERTQLDLRGTDVEELAIPDLETTEIPAGAVVIDLRSKAEYDGWHCEGAVWLDFAHAMKAYPAFDRSKVYVLTCEFGLKSAHLAEFMRKDGFDAANFRGGIRALRRLAGF
jgi:thiamine biosynthesis protein ThiI